MAGVYHHCGDPNERSKWFDVAAAIRDFRLLHNLLLDMDLTSYDIGIQDMCILNEAREITSAWVKEWPEVKPGRFQENQDNELLEDSNDE